MVNPGAFSGSRREFLDAQKDIYADAVSANHVADTVADIQRRYFKRYPITLPHDEEPTQEWLDQVNDNGPDPDVLPPDPDTTEPDAYLQASLEYETLKKEIKMRKDQIKRRLQYQYNKARDDQTSFDKGTLSPLAILTAKLTGVGLKKPRLRTPYNIWGPEHRFFVDPIFKQRVEENNVPARNQAALRSAIYKELFNDLPEDEKKEWAERAEQEHRLALEEIESKIGSNPSTSPEDRQKIIQALPKFVEPILDLIAAHTGWKVTLIAGGPEPADGGRLNMVSIHSGVISGSVKMDFGRSERQAYRNYVIPTFGTFLKKCYSIDECRSRALPSENSATKLSVIGVEEDVDVHHFDVDPAHVYVSKSRVPSAGSESSSSGKSSSTTNTPAPIKFGPPKGRKPGVLRPLPSRNAYTVKLGPAPKPTATSAGTAAPSVHPAPASACAPTPRTPTLVHASTIPERTTGVIPGPALSNELAPVNSAAVDPPHAPTPVVSRAPTPALSRAPTPATSRAPTPAISRAPTPAISLEPTPAPSHTTHTPPPLSLPALTLSQGAADHDPHTSIVPAPPAPIASQLPTSSSSSATVDVEGRAIDTSLIPGIGSTMTTPPPNITSSPVAPDPTPSPVYTPPAEPLPSPLPPAPQRPVFKPSGAATVPDPSTFASSSTTRSRKRKGVRPGEDGDDEKRASKRTRSSTSTGPGKSKGFENEGEQVQKKTKRSGNVEFSTGAFELSVPSECPKWITNALQMITAVDLGEKWRSLAAAWIEFEQSHGFEQDGSQLGSQHRPRVVADWIRRARNPKYRPVLKNIKSFKDSFWTWWMGLQPDWRHVEGSEELQRRDEEDWDVLRCSGQNGILSVVAALFFWGLAVTGDESSREAWDVVVDDVLYAMANLF